MLKGQMTPEVTPLTVFWMSFVASAITALGAEALNHEKELTAQTAIGTVLFYGGLGSGLAYFACYEWFGKPVSLGRGIAASLLVGCRVLTVKVVRDWFYKMVMGMAPTNKDDNGAP